MVDDDLDDAVTVSDIIYVLNLPSARNKSKANVFIQSTPMVVLEKEQDTDSKGVQDRQRTPKISPPPESVKCLNEDDDYEQQSTDLYQRLQYSRKPPEAIGRRDNPFSFLLQQFLATEIRRSVTHDEFRTRSSGFNGTSASKGSDRSPEVFDAWIPLHPSSLSDHFIALENLLNEKSGTLSEFEMGTLYSVDNTRIFDPIHWRQKPDQCDENHQGAIEVDSYSDNTRATRNPGKDFRNDESDPDVRRRGRRRRGRFKFRGFFEGLLGTRRLTAEVVPGTVSNPVYSFPDPLSKQSGSLDLVALSNEGSDWRETVDPRSIDETEQRIIDRLIQIVRLEQETVASESTTDQTRCEKNVSNKTIRTAQVNLTECSTVSGLMSPPFSSRWLNKPIRKLEVSLNCDLRGRNAIRFSQELHSRRYPECSDAEQSQNKSQNSASRLPTVHETFWQKENRKLGRFKSPLKQQKCSDYVLSADRFKYLAVTDREVKGKAKVKFDKSVNQSRSGFVGKPQLATVFGLSSKPSSDQSDSIRNKKLKTEVSRKTKSNARDRSSPKRPYTAG